MQSPASKTREAISIAISVTPPAEKNEKSMADGAVSIELVSGVKFPVKQGKNREFLRFWRR
jgi:hypothetical protein